MNKVLIKGQEFNLSGEIIKVGDVLDFKAVNRENEDVQLSDVKGTKVISVFPDINTRVCDMQTVRIAQIAQKAAHIHFISISLDSVEVINSWCAANGLNVDIWSDAKYKDFAKNTNTLIPSINKLARGFIILDKENKIVAIDFVEELTHMPDFDLIEKHI